MPPAARPRSEARPHRLGYRGRRRIPLCRGGVEGYQSPRWGFEQMVGRWSEAEHLATLARPNHAYLLGTNTAGECAAFAIIRDLDDAHGNLCLKRIAVTNPDKGFGSKFLSLVVDWAFSEIACHRLWLEVLVNNARARHVYSSHGFADEGLLRGAFKLPDDSRTDLVLMSLTRPEWIGLRGKHA